MIAIAGAWLILSVLTRSRRKSLGLRSLEDAADGGLPAPNYQTSMDARKDAALAKGDAYEDARTQPEANETANLANPSSASDGWSKWLSFARIGTLIVASLNLGITLVAALAAGGEVNEMVETISLSERWEAVFNKYWIGIAAAGFIVLLEIGRWLSKRGSPAASTNN